ncbi:MFS family permease [Mycetocola sp. BIGb0189]|uniref:MFS transporter n=1 Tax=Mycetocola sp. BIGb0189 TaxID=2940604 RepID=UPI00216891D4|nr:MFS transporter [Mycetocola sp. BIGb0189]MCS4275835.1 MFS family permease [Mycetocola sp. BIGb0189]
MSAVITRAESIGFGPKFAIPILIGPALNPINTTMIAVALTPIAHAVNVSAATVIWLVAGLYLVSAVSQPAMGKLADTFGPRRVYLTGLAIVAAAGIIPTLLPTFGGVLLARLLLGLGTSAAYPSAMTLISDQSARLEKPTPQVLLSGLSISSLVTSSIGPVLGGVLIHAFGWQSIFLVNIPLALIAFVLAWLWLPGDKTRVRGARTVSAWKAIDPPGLLLFAITVVALLMFLLDLSSGLYWLLPIAAVALGTLIWREYRAQVPFIDVRMLVHNGPLARTYLRLMLVFTGSYLVVYAMSQWLQTDVGLAPSTAGLYQIPTAIVAGICSVLVARAKRIRGPLIIAAAAPMVGGLLLSSISSGDPTIYILVVLAVFGLPQGLASISNQAALYRQAPAGQIGVAAGLSRTSVQLGAIVASSIIGIVYGQAPSDAGLNTIGWIVAGLTASALVLTVLDRSLRSPKK